MARKKEPSRLVDKDITKADTPGLPAAMQTLALSADVEKDEILAAGIDLGRIEALDFVATIANSAVLAIYENVKKSKAWKLLRNTKSCDGRNFSSLDEFCEVKLGTSYRRMQELIANRKLIGQEAFEQAEKIGLRQMDYRAIKALPAPKQEIIKEALAEGADLSTVTDALHRLAAEYQQETESLTKRAEEAEANLGASRTARFEKDEEITRLKGVIKLAETRINKIPPDEIGQQIRAEASQIAYAAEAEIRGNLLRAFQELEKQEEEHGLRHADFMLSLVCQIELELRKLRGEFDLVGDQMGEDDSDYMTADDAPLEIPEHIRSKKP